MPNSSGLIPDTAREEQSGERKRWSRRGRYVAGYAVGSRYPWWAATSTALESVRMRLTTYIRPGMGEEMKVIHRPRSTGLLTRAKQKPDK